MEYFQVILTKYGSQGDAIEWLGGSDRLRPHNLHQTESRRPELGHGSHAERWLPQGLFFPQLSSVILTMVFFFYETYGVEISHLNWFRKRSEHEEKLR